MISLYSSSYLGIPKPTLRVIPCNLGVITCYYVGFGATGRVSGLGFGIAVLAMVLSLRTFKAFLTGFLRASKSRVNV